MVVYTLDSRIPMGRLFASPLVSLEVEYDRPSFILRERIGLSVAFRAHA